MAEEKKKGFFANNLFPKIILLLAVGIVIAALLFGLPTDLGSAFWFIIKVLVAIGLFVFAITIMQKVVTGKPDFSPTKSWKEKLINMAVMCKPARTKNLSMRGEDLRTYYPLGKILGLLFVPYWAGKPVVNDKTGKFEYVHKADRLGKLMYNPDGSPVLIHKLVNITERDGDWLFVVKRGLFGKRFLVRAHKNLCSDIGVECWIKTVNVLEVNGFYYPNQQWQSDILRINMQNLAETIEQTHAYFLDLCATTTESSLRSDPTFVRMLQANTEVISSKENAPIQQLGR